MDIICAYCDRQTGRGDACEHCGDEPTLRGRYELEEVVGEGASGTTYRARDVEEERTVAIKEMGIHGIETFKAHELFEREADVLCRLEHPGVPTFYDYFEWGEGKALRFYLVMEFVEGETLLEDLDGRQHTVETARDVVWQLAEIARYLHGLSPPVIHRDIKPSNVLRRPDGELVLIDFGSVRDALEADTSGSTIAGTIGYMAPEQLRGLATPASDVYGIGATAIHLLTRCEPTQLLGPTNRLEWQEHVDLPRSLARVMEQMLATDPADRISDGDALMKALVDADVEEQEPQVERLAVIRCDNCGHEHEDDYRFCLACGAALPAPGSEHPWGGVSAERSPSRPARQSAGAAVSENSSEVSERDSGNFTASMVLLLCGTTVIGLICGGWLTMSTGGESTDYASEALLVAEPESSSELPWREEGDPGMMDIDDMLRDLEMEPAVQLEPTGEDDEHAIGEPPGDVHIADDVYVDDEPVERLSKKEVLDEMKRHYDHFRACSDGSVGRGYLMVNFEVAEGGDVSFVDIRDDDASEAFSSCVAQVFDDMEFPEAEQSQEVNFPIPLE